MTLASISSAEYEDFRRFLEEACGILLGDNKHYLVQSRLGRMVNDAGVVSLGDLVNKLRVEPSGGPLREKVIEAMTTNETFWFRDNHPFRILSDQVFPGCMQRKQRTVRIWSAACSTGQVNRHAQAPSARSASMRRIAHNGRSTVNAAMYSYRSAIASRPTG